MTVEDGIESEIFFLKIVPHPDDGDIDVDHAGEIEWGPRDHHFGIGVSDRRLQIPELGVGVSHRREHGIDHRIVERQPVDAKRRDYQVLGDAAELGVLKEAGIENAPSVIITTNDDDMNIYLTIYCRKLRPDMQIIARSTKDRSIATLHHAGADLVMSYASIGANAVLNFLRGYQELLVTEGLNVFSLAVPKRLSGKTLEASRIRERTGCSVVALRSYEDMIFNPDPSHKLRRGEQLILIGRADAPKEFAMRRHAARP